VEGAGRTGDLEVTQVEECVETSATQSLLQAAIEVAFVWARMACPHFLPQQDTA